MYGADINIKTDHKNFIRRGLKYPHLMYWWLLIEIFTKVALFTWGIYFISLSTLSINTSSFPEKSGNLVTLGST